MQIQSTRAQRKILRSAASICASILLLFSAMANAQLAGSGNIQGTATDATGAVVVNATVTLINEATHVTRTTKTSNAGVFLFPSIPVGTYDLTASAPGFKTYAQTGIVLEVGSSIAVNPKFAVGAADVKVEVQAEGLALQTEDPTFKQTIDQNEVTAMPLNGRQMTALIALSGGANKAPGGDFTGNKYSYQAVSISIAGGAGNTTLWRLDGGDNQDYMGNANLPYPFPDAVSQFSVESTALGAQDGGHVGGMVNVVTRSGTNNYHGEAFEFLRNNYIDATNFYSKSPDVLHLNQFGGTFGGPIKRNKMFAFAGYQRTVETQQQKNIEKYIPTADNLKGDFSYTDGVPGVDGSNHCSSKGAPVPLFDPLTGTKLVGNSYAATGIPFTVNPQAQALMKYLPTPENNCGLVTYSIPKNTYDNQFVTRVDWNISSKQNLYGRYFVDGWQQPAFFYPNNILVTTQSGNIERVQSFTMGDAYTITPNMVNAAHISIMRRVNHRGYNLNDINAATLGVNLYQAAKAGLQLGVSGGNGSFSMGGGTNSLSHFNDNTLSVSDDVTWVRGKNQWMFGGQWVQNQLNIGNVWEGNGSFGFTGKYSGNGPNGGKLVGDANLDFLQGTLSSFEQSQEQQNALRGPIPSLYIQDTYHATPRLTVTGGLRWGPNIMPVDYFNRGVEFNMADFMSNTISTVYPKAPAGVRYYGDKGVTRQFTKNSAWQFSPNLGISYDPTGKGITVIRAGGALMYDNPNFFTAQRNQQNPPFATAVSNQQTSSSGPLSFSDPWSVGTITSSPFPMPSVPTPSQALFFAQSLYTVNEPQFHPAYTIQWTLSVQRQFGRGWQAQVDYIGNTTRHSPLSLPLNGAVFIPGLWGPNGTGCDPIVKTGPAAVKPGAEGTNCSTTGNQISRFQLTMLNPAQGNAFEGGGGGSASGIIQGGVNANYNGLVTTVQHRLSATFSLLANWTWAKCLNIVDAAGDYHGSNVSNPNNPSMDYGPCGSDYRNIENMSLVTRSNFHSTNRLERLLINDWEFAPLMSISTGGPVNITSGQDNSLTDVGSDRPNRVGGVNPYQEVNFRSGTSQADREYLNPAAFAQVTATCPTDSNGKQLPGCQYLGTYGNISRNAFRGPKSFSLDAQVSRMFPIHESVALTLRLEAFNMLNHPNFGNPDAKITDSKFGQVSSASAARVFQGAVKFSF